MLGMISEAGAVLGLTCRRISDLNATARMHRTFTRKDIENLIFENGSVIIVLRIEEVHVSINSVICEIVTRRS